MFSAESTCAINLANDATETGELFSCTSCSVRAHLNQDGIVEVVTRNICMNLTIDASTSTELAYGQLQTARRPEFDI